jgi:hypothetical protein
MASPGREIVRRHYLAFLANEHIQENRVLLLVFRFWID